MATRKKTRSTKRRAKRKSRVVYRRNSWTNNAAGHSKAARKGWRRRKAAPKAKRRKRRNPWSSGARSFVPMSMRSNPFRRKRSRRYRRNPNFAGAMRNIISRKSLINAGKIGGGFALGALTIPLIYSVSPAALQQQSRFFGVVNILLGGMLTGLVKNKDVKDIGLVIAGVGMYDLLQQNVPTLNLPAIPRSNPMISGMLPTSSLSASYMTARSPSSALARAGVGASYMPSLGATYMAPNQRTVGLGADWNTFANDPYQGVFG